MVSARHIARTLRENAEEHGEKEALKNFFAFIEARNLQHLLGSVLSYLERLRAREKEEKTLKISSAFPLSDDLIEKIKGYMEADGHAGKQIKTDESLIGGFVAEFEGSRVDASVRKQITKLRAALLS